MLDVNVEDFNKEVLEADVPVVVDFWAAWCGPCKMMAPILEEVEKEVGDKVKFVKVDVDKESDLATKYSIIAIPNIIIFEGGQIKENIVGITQKDMLLDLLKGK